MQGQPFCKPTAGIITQYWSPGHPAIDIAQGTGKGPPVYAPYDGTVTYAAWENGGCGWRVYIDHGYIASMGQNIGTIYCHMGSGGDLPSESQSYIQVSNGQQVTRGQIIGYQGMAGASTGTHLHWQLDPNSLNPINYMSSTVCTEVPPVDPPIITIDHPRTEIVAGQTVLIDGWAIHSAADSGTGISKVHIYLDGPAGEGGTMIGTATYGTDRPDVARVHGDRYRYSGYRFNWDSDDIEPGSHKLYIYAYNTTTNEWSHKTRDIVILPPSDNQVYLPLIQR
jgi:hypothetical protein